MRAPLALLAGLTAALSAGECWTPQDSGVIAGLRGISAVGRDVAWAGGAKGTLLRTVDGGSTWAKLAVPGAEAFDFRDVQAVDARTCYALSIGAGDLSRIWKTVDGGATWTVQHANRDPRGFLDAIAFWDAENGLALGDPVDGRYVVLATSDGGKTWAKVPDAGMPPALPGEGAFAASGTCLAVQGDSNAWFATGGGASSRVFRSTDRGRTWAVAEAPIRAGSPSRGIFSLAFRDAMNGLAVGGDYRMAEDPGVTIAATTDGGRTWTALDRGAPPGFRSAVAFVPGSGAVAVAVGPAGTDVSPDGGKTWKRAGTFGYHALGLAKDGAGWAVGEGGRIGKLNINALKE